MSSLLRIVTVGSVDDGKSTLIGRLLHDADAVFADQLADVERIRRQRGELLPNLALLTDGLRSEREQGITIDVAYRYFSTPRRKFIVADTPGHIQYTRNMVTGASTAHLALILVDARKGVLEQSRRHAFIASLLGIRHLTVCVNKMDMVDWSQRRFDDICTDFRGFAAGLDVPDLTCIPISALYGDNVVQRGTNAPWYEGGPVLQHLETVAIASDDNMIDVRLPVQYVTRPQQPPHEFRGCAGTISGGRLRSGDEVIVLPAGHTTRVAAMYGPGGDRLTTAYPPQSVLLELADELDVARGDLICHPGNQPHLTNDLHALLCWLTDRSTLTSGTRYVIQHATRETRATVVSVDYRLDVNTLHRDRTANTLALNEIGRVRLRTHQPLMFDTYRRNRDTGSFVLIDETSNDTVAAGMITGPSTNVLWHQAAVSRQQRATRGMTVWLTGLPAAGKSTVAGELGRALLRAAQPVYVLDGDNLRHGLNADLGFSAKDRAENVRRTGEVAKLIADAGVVAVVALISPYRADRDRVRASHDQAGLPFLEVFVDTPLAVCESRDPKGLYAKARAGEISTLTGVDDPYEPPLHPDITLSSATNNPLDLAAELMAAVMRRIQ
ncbi:MAG TPA: adenylyl-sulfate kinase [Pseudonocardiaceae bacterium]|nr:adenylyl-sulfate kinase [Pseudonocardiaceae bacterium]